MTFTATTHVFNRDTGAPIAGAYIYATIYVDGLGYQVQGYTDDGGNLVRLYEHAGVYRVNVSKEGFVTWDAEKIISNDPPYNNPRISLNPVVVPVPGPEAIELIVSVKSGGEPIEGAVINVSIWSGDQILPLLTLYTGSDGLARGDLMSGNKYTVSVFYQKDLLLEETFTTTREPYHISIEITTITPPLNAGSLQDMLDEHLTWMNIAKAGAVVVLVGFGSKAFKEFREAFKK